MIKYIKIIAVSAKFTAVRGKVQRCRSSALISSEEPRKSRCSGTAMPLASWSGQGLVVQGSMGELVEMVKIEKVERLKIGAYREL